MKPATPLPWKSMAFTWILGEKADVNVYPEGIEYVEDKRYIVHACNAYPHLIAALKGCTNPNNTERLVSCVDARALLRELGEDK